MSRRKRILFLSFPVLFAGLAWALHSSTGPAAKQLATGPELSALTGIVRVASAAPAERTTFVTYNAGLARGIVPFAEERLDPIVADLAKLDADVLCLQEVWRDEDFREIQAALETRLPHAYRHLTRDPNPPRTEAMCGVRSTLAVALCARRKCDPQGIAPEACVQGACAAEYDALDADCPLCLAANATSPAGCLWRGAGHFVGQGRNGLALLSRHAIERPRYREFDSLLVRRGVLSAEIGSRTVHCTHLTADLASIPYAQGLGHASWAEEHRAAVEVLAGPEAETEAPECEVLLGDLNAGPGGVGASGEDFVEAEWPQNFDALLEAGYRRPSGPPRCTFCVENPLTGLGRDLALDHVLVRGCGDTALLDGRRVLDREVRLEDRVVRLSDHYGVALSLLR